MTLQEAVAVFAADYPMKVSTLRAAIAAGRIVPARVAGKYYVTPATIRAMFRPSAADEAEAQGRREMAERMARATDIVTSRRRDAEAERRAAPQASLTAALESSKDSRRGRRRS